MASDLRRFRAAGKAEDTALRGPPRLPDLNRQRAMDGCAKRLRVGRMRILFSLILTMLTALPAVAGPDRVALHIGSAHFGTDRGFEEVNPGLFLTWERRVNLSLGAYRNSYGRLSVAATVGVDVWEQGRARLEAFGGLAHYPRDGRTITGRSHDVVPIIGLRAHYDPVFVSIIPGDGDRMDGLLSFGLSFALDQ